LPSPPNAPLNPHAVAIANGQIRITWDIVTNAEIYRVYRDVGTNLDIPGTIVVDNLTTNVAVDLPPADGPYHYAITASRRGSESVASGIVVATSDRVPPPTPTGVTAQLASSGVAVNWIEAGGETPDHFNVYRNGTLISSIKGAASITDYPPRGVANYTVGAVDAAGNEALSSAATVSLLVGGVQNLVALAAAGQAVAVTWDSSDSTAVGFNVYRNGAKQNITPIAQNGYVDPISIGAQPVTYAITAQNAQGQEGAPRSVVVYPARLTLIVNSATDVSGSTTTRYFDEYRVQVANIGGGATALPLSRIEVRRTMDGADTVDLARNVAIPIAGGQSIEQKINVPEPQFFAPEKIRVRAIQQSDSEVIYQNSFDKSDVFDAGLMIDVTANQLPLSGGLATLEVQVFNRGYANLEFITATENGAKPGDIYVSVKNTQGQEVGRTAFTGTPKGTFFLNDGRAFATVPGGGSLKFDIPNILVADALGTNQAIFEVVISKTYNGLIGTDTVQGGDLRGTMISSLAQTPYYGIAHTAKTGYADEEPIVITGQAIDRNSGQPVPNADLTIGFSARGFRWSRNVTTDATGSFSYEYTPTPGFAGNLNIWAAHPLVFDQLNQVSVTYYRLYPQPFQSNVRMSKNDNLDFSISLVNPGDIPLTGFTLDVNAYTLNGTNQVPVTNVTGTAAIDASFVVPAGKTVPINLSLQAAADAPDNVIVEYTLHSTEGASAKFTAVVTLLPAVPVLTMVDPTVGYLEVSLDRGTLLSRQITVQNKGLKDLKGVTLTPPSSNSWMTVNLPVGDDGQIHLPDLGVGQSRTFSVVFSPSTDVALDFYSDQIKIRGTNATAEFDLNVYALITSSQKGAVQFEVDDILGDAVPNATVRMRNGLLQMELPVVTTDSAGLVTISDIQEGDWSWQVLAPGHSGTVGTVHIVPSQTVQVHTRLSKSLVTIDFTVVPVPYTDKYEIKLEQTFETHVPAPVMVLDPAFKDFKNIAPGFEANFIVTVKNYGLIQLTDVVIKGSAINGGVLTPLIEYFPLLLPQQTVEVPFVFTYNTPGGSQQGQRRQFDGGTLAGCLVGAMPFGALADPAVLQGLAAIFAGAFQCVKDLSPQQAAATLAAVFALGQIAGAWGSAAEFLVGFVGQALSCIIGNLLPDLGGGGGGFSGGPGDGAYNVANVACFEPGTKILLDDGTLRPIEEVKTNDVVRVGPRSADVARVSQTFKRPAEMLREIDCEGGHKVHATREHQFWVDGRGWVAAANLRVGDHLMNDKGQRVRINHLVDLENKQPVYTFSVAGDNAFYANGILVHDMCANEKGRVLTAQSAGGPNAQ
jgi:fibronectin type 3 domain-containing protein